MPQSQRGFTLSHTLITCYAVQKPTCAQCVWQSSHNFHTCSHALFFSKLCWAGTILLSVSQSFSPVWFSPFRSCLLLSPALCALHWVCAPALSAAADVCYYRQLHSLGIPYCPHSALSISSSFPSSSHSISLPLLPPLLSVSEPIGHLVLPVTHTHSWPYAFNKLIITMLSACTSTQDTAE